ncbi:MAG: radical SAM family heme chaperone HemW [Alphaproteobacteria bacterium]|nr:radical SAM family heme chaperone HemW [Alphaproteobacteria bacterium]
MKSFMVDLINNNKNPGFGIYIHWPFCSSKCPYCDFASREIPNDLVLSDWAKAYSRELEYFASITPNRVVTSIYFGGGTPSLMEAWLVKDIIDNVKMLWDVVDNVEVSFEVNPDGATYDKLIAYRDAGVNRLSIGVQSLDDEALKFLGRCHDVKQAVKSIEMAGNIFPKVSFDIMYGRAEQSLQDWEVELRNVLKIAKTNNVTHLSLYQLTIEEGTPFHSRYQSKAFVLPDEEVLADMFEITQKITREAGFPAYEVSNHAVLGDDSRHNMTYWLGADYVGVGASAHARITNSNGETEAFEQEAIPSKWLSDANSKLGGGIKIRQTLSPTERAEELLLSGLRLCDGVSLSGIAKIVGLQDASEIVNMNAANDLCGEGFLECKESGDSLAIKVTSKGFVLLNSILTKISA